MAPIVDAIDTLNSNCKQIKVKKGKNNLAANDEI